MNQVHRFVSHHDTLSLEAIQTEAKAIAELPDASFEPYLMRS